MIHFPMNNSLKAPISLVKISKEAINLLVWYLPSSDRCSFLPSLRVSGRHHRIASGKLNLQKFNSGFKMARTMWSQVTECVTRLTHAMPTNTSDKGRGYFLGFAFCQRCQVFPNSCDGHFSTQIWSTNLLTFLTLPWGVCLLNHCQVKPRTGSHKPIWPERLLQERKV